MKCIIVHGAYGSPEENWFLWLKHELEQLGLDVAVPRFPTPEGQSLDAWIKILDGYNSWFGEDLILVGHSLGPSLILRKLESMTKSVRAAFFVAGFAKQIGKPEFDSINATFVEKEFDWNQIRANCKHFEVFHSDNDPYVPLSFGETLANKLGVKLTMVNGAGHFNKAAGYLDFPMLLERIRKQI